MPNSFYNNAWTGVANGSASKSSMVTEFDLVATGMTSVENIMDELVRVPANESVAALGNAAARAKTVLSFDANGAPSLGYPTLLRQVKNFMIASFNDVDGASHTYTGVNTTARFHKSVFPPASSDWPVGALSSVTPSSSQQYELNRLGWCLCIYSAQWKATTYGNAANRDACRFAWQWTHEFVSPDLTYGFDPNGVGANTAYPMTADMLPEDNSFENLTFAAIVPVTNTTGGPQFLVAPALGAISAYPSFTIQNESAFLIPLGKPVGEINF